MYPSTHRRHSSRQGVAIAKFHGAYVALGGLWPLVNMYSFELVTGPRSEEWLVRTVAGVLLLLGAMLLNDAFRRKHIDRGLRYMAAGISGVLGLVAVVSSLGGWISWVYFFDGILHLTFTIAWVGMALAQRSVRHQ